MASPNENEGARISLASGATLNKITTCELMIGGRSRNTTTLLDVMASRFCHFDLTPEQHDPFYGIRRIDACFSWPKKFENEGARISLASAPKWLEMLPFGVPGRSAGQAPDRPVAMLTWRTGRPGDAF